MADQSEYLDVLEQALSDPAQADKHDRIRAVLAKAGRAPAAGGPPELAARRKALTHQEGEGSASDSLPVPAHGPTFMDSVKTMGRGVKELGSVALDEAKSLPGSFRSVMGGGPKTDELSTNPARARQLVRGGSDVFLGAPVAIADAIHSARGDGHPMASVEAQDAESNPNTRTAGSIATMMVPNPYGAAARAVSPAVNAAFARVPVRGPVAGAGMGAVKGALTYEATAPAMSALGAETGDRMHAARTAATDPLGLFLATGVGAAGGAGRGNAAKIRDPRNRSGRVLRDVEQAGGPGARINKFGEPIEGGIYESPEMRDLPVGRQGRHELADSQAQGISEANAARLKAARAQYGDTVDEIIASHGQTPHPTTNAHQALSAMEAENTVNGVTGDPGVGSAIEKVRSMLTQQGAVRDDAATLANVMKATGIPSNAKLTPAAQQALLAQAAPQHVVMKAAQQVSAPDMVKARKIVRQLANQAPTPSENRAYQVVLGAMDKDAEAIDPRIREMNANFAKAMEPIERSNSLLFGKQGRAPEVSDAQRATGARRLGQVGDETQAGTVLAPQMDELSQLGPEYERAVRLMRARKAQDLLRRGPPETSEPIDKSLGNLRMPTRFKIPYLPIEMSLGTNQSPLANQIRLGLPASETVGKLSGRSAVGVDALTRVAHKRGKKKQEQKETSP